MILEGQEVTVYFKEHETVEGIGIVRKIHQLLFDDKYALVELEFKTGTLKGEIENRIVENK